MLRRCSLLPSWCGGVSGSQDELDGQGFSSTSTAEILLKGSRARAGRRGFWCFWQEKQRGELLWVTDTSGVEWRGPRVQRVCDEPSACPAEPWEQLLPPCWEAEQCQAHFAVGIIQRGDRAPCGHRAGNGGAVGTALTQTFILPWEQGDFWGFGVSVLPLGCRQEHSSRCAEKAAVTLSFPCFQKS